MGESKLHLCAAHGIQTRLDCVSCGEPICLLCQVETERGLMCARCASGPVRTRTKRRVVAAAALLGGLALLGLAAIVLDAAISPSGRTPRPPGQWVRVPELSVVRGAT